MARRSSLLGFFLAAVLTSALAPDEGISFELDLKIYDSWSYQYVTQHGSNGFFGPYNSDNRPSALPVPDPRAQGRFAPLNGWPGGRMVSGCDLGVSRLYTEMQPTFRVNEAVEMSALYVVGTYRTSDSPGVSEPFSTGNWLFWDIKATTPLGRVFYGKTGFGSDDSLQFDINVRSEEYLMFQWDFKWHYPAIQLLEETKRADESEGVRPTKSPWDPFYAFGAENFSSPCVKLWLGFYPWRRGATNRDRLFRDRFLLNYGAGDTATSYWNVEDSNAARAINLMGFLRYYTAHTKTGLLAICSRYRSGPESQQIQGVPPLPAPPPLAPPLPSRMGFPPSDTDLTEGAVYFEFNNGRLFAQTSLNWYYRTIRYQRSVDGTFNRLPEFGYDASGSRFAPEYVESLRFKFEGGAFLGPLAVSFLYTHMPGPDRRRGALIDRQPYILDGQLAAPTLFGRYAPIMANMYSGGAGFFGDLSDASCLGARLDYMLASNLHLRGSFLHATRVSHGYGWGSIRPTTEEDETHAVAGGVTTAPAFGSVSYGIRFDDAIGIAAPAIPDRNLGWEIDAGLTWELLRNWKVNFNVGYWRPGRWFSYACVDKSVPDWDTPTVANNFGANPNRTIDPVTMVSLSVVTKF